MNKTRKGSEHLSDVDMRVRKKLLFLVLGLIILLVFVQFAKLLTIGRVGGEIAEIKIEQDRLTLENELLSAEINELKTPSNLIDSLPAYGNFVTKEAQVLAPDGSFTSEPVAIGE